jgi:hypothetical protein
MVRGISFLMADAGQLAKHTEGKPIGIIPFVTELARYFMDFLETDFHKVRSPKRKIQTRNSNNLQVCINLNKYKKYFDRAWRSVATGFEGDPLNRINRGDYTTAIPQSLMNLIQDQIKIIKQSDVDDLIKLFNHEVDLGISKHPKDTPAAISQALEGINRVLREKFIALFINKIREPLESLQTTTVDSAYHVKEELADVFGRPFEDAVSSIVNYITLKKVIDRDTLLKQAFELEDIRHKLDSYFKGFAAGDLFFEASDLFNNKALLENQEFYFYFCDITYKSQTYPLFYIPVQIKKDVDGFELTFDSLVYVNKKAVQFLSQDYNVSIDRKGTLTAFSERIIYLADKRPHLIGEVDLALKELVNYFGLAPYVDVTRSERQIAKSPSVQLSNSCYLGLFDKSEESLINDYEEILQKLHDGNDELAGAFKTLVDDFITTNPVSVVPDVENEWDEYSCDDKLVYASPVPLNEEQRLILSALAKSNCKYVSVEGPPGTGKSHTITAIACDAVLKNQSILVLSDKKEALDVVEDKITQTLNKVRLDKDFQNPILRLGQAGNTYTKILSSSSMSRIKNHYRAVRNEYQKLEKSVDQSRLVLKEKIKNTVAVYDKIKIADIAEFEKLEKHFIADEKIPIDINEQISSESLRVARDAMRDLGRYLADPGRNTASIFNVLYPNDQSIVAFGSFLIYLTVLDQLRSNASLSIPHLSKIRKISDSNLSALQDYIEKCNQLRSGVFGLLFKGGKLAKLNEELSVKLSHNFEKPQNSLAELRKFYRFSRAPHN